MLTIESRQAGHTILVTVSGSVTFETMRPLTLLLQEIYTKRQAKFLVLNLEAVNHVDSSGIGLLVASRNVMNRNRGQLYLCELRPAVKRVLESMNLLNYFFSVCDTEQEALEGAARLSPFEAADVRFRTEEELLVGS